MGMKYIAAVLIISFVFGWAQENEEAPEKTYRFGARYQDLRTIPWLIQDKVDDKEFNPPPSVDHSPYMPPVGDQGNQGSCVAWATAYYYKTYQEWLEHGWSVADSEHQFSPAFMYNQVNGGVDNGMWWSDALKLLIDHGCCSIADFPYDDSNFTDWASETAYYNAILFRCQEGHWVDIWYDHHITAVKQHIADGDNVVIGIWCWDNFIYINNFDTVFCVADVYGTMWGGHGVCVVGYDDDKMTNDGPGAFRIVNSWGTDWGNQGYFWMSYEAVKNALTSYQFAMYTTDRIGYSPRMLTRFRISHPKREWIRMSMGIANDWYKVFFNWEESGVEGHPFPDNNIVFDITEGISYLDPYDTNNVYLRCKDNQSDGFTGTVEHLSSVNNELGTFSRSFEIPQTIPDYNVTIFVNLTMPTQMLHWQSFHRLPDNTGITQLTGDMDSVQLLWSYSTGGDVVSSACLGDIDGDNTLEVVIGSYDGKIYTLKGESGESLWTYTTGNVVFGSPCLGDIDGDGQTELVVGSEDDNIYALNGEDGSLLWSYQANGWVVSSPCLGDVEGDGGLDVVVGSYDSLIYTLNGEDGSLLWSYKTGGYVFSSPCIGDIDGDGRPEIIFGSQDDYVYALNGEDASLLWSYPTGDRVNSSPCVSDIDDDGKLEVTVGSIDSCMYALNGEDGSLLWSYKTNEWINSSPALGDVDNDGMIEVVFGSWDHYVYALNAEDGSLLWAFETDNEVISSPSLGDIDGDGTCDIVVGSGDDRIYALRGDGSLLWSYQTGNNVRSSPCLGDIDGDGRLEVVVGSEDNNVYALNGWSPGIEEITANTSNNPRFSLLQNLPNPFAKNTVIGYSLQNACKVELKIFDVAGRQIAVLVDENQKSGYYQVNWDSRGMDESHLANGVYFYRLTTGDFRATKKMIICR